MKFSPNKNYQVQINKSMFSQKETLKMAHWLRPMNFMGISYLCLEDGIPVME